MQWKWSIDKVRSAVPFWSELLSLRRTGDNSILYISVPPWRRVGGTEMWLHASNYFLFAFRRWAVYDWSCLFLLDCLVHINWLATLYSWYLTDQRIVYFRCNSLGSPVLQINEHDNFSCIELHIFYNNPWNWCAVFVLYNGQHLKMIMNMYKYNIFYCHQAVSLDTLG